MSTAAPAPEPVYGDRDAAADYFDQLGDFAVVLDADLRIIAVCAAARATFGDRLTVGVPVDSVAEIVPQGFVDAARSALVTGQAVVLPESRMDVTLADGTEASLAMDFLYHPRRDAAGNVIGVLGRAIDATERVERRRRAEEEAAEVAARYERSRAAVATLQASLLADRLPVLPAADVAASYGLAAADQAAGGDWYDVVARADGTLVVVVGDVVGHGIEASVAMGRLRTLAVERLEEHASIVETVEVLDRWAARHPEAYAATVCIVELHVHSGEFEYVTAGHPPPLVVDLDAPDGDGAVYLEPSGAGPLGTRAVPATARGHLGPDQVMVLITDGAFERPGVAPAQGTVAVARAAQRAAADRLFPYDHMHAVVDRVTSQLSRHLDRVSPRADDTTIVAVRRRSPLTDLEVEAVADDRLPDVCRHALRAWLAPALPGADDLDLLDHLVTELTQNAVDHAYPPAQPGPVRLRGHLGADGTVTVSVADRGVWRPPQPSGDRGRGLALARQLGDISVETGVHGTTATLRVALRRPVWREGSEAAHRDASHPGRFDVYQLPQRTPVTVEVVGPVDQRAAHELGAHLALALTEAHGGPLAVDLRGVSMLTSAGVAALYAFLRGAEGVASRVDLVAPPGSPAHHTLTLVGLPTTPGSPAARLP